MSPIRRFGLSILAVLLAAACCRAAELETLAAGAAADLQKALDELAAVRKSVEAERAPLARQVRDLEQQLADKRAEAAKAQRFQENQLVELNALKAEARQRADEVKYVESVLGEYARAFRSRLNFVEEPRHRAMFEAVEKAAVAPDLAPAERFSQRSVLLATALRRADAILGGEILEGRALDRLGRVQSGKVALVGPVAMFVSASGDTAGLLQQELNKADPSVLAADPSAADAGRALVASGTGVLLLDPTLGNAFRMAALHETFFEQLAKGGLIMVPLIGLGLASVLVALFKWVQLVRVRMASEADLQSVLGHLGNADSEKAVAHAKGIPGMVGQMLVTAVEHADEKKEYIEEILYEKMLAARARLDRGLAFLALAATTGPLMGLLGTVMGMIATFKVISSSGSGDPKQLAAGISEALICTATGMAVAIPSLLLHAFLSRKAKGIIGGMEQTAVGFINGIPQQDRSPFAR